VTRTRWIICAAISVAIGAGLWIWRLDRPTGEDILTPQARSALTTYARDAIENGALPYEMPDRGNLACAVRVFGTDPPSVTVAANATTVYAWIMCATVGTEVQTSFLLPVAIHHTDPPSAQEPIDGDGNEREATATRGTSTAFSRAACGDRPTTKAM
jgi:hypothetical protein